MADETAKKLRLYLSKYLVYADGNIGKFSFIKWLSSANLSTNSKYFISRLLGKFLVFAGKLTEEDFKVVKTSFRQEHKLKKIDVKRENIVFILEKIDEYSRVAKERNLLAAFILATIGLRVEQLLNLKLSDITITEDSYEFSFDRQKQNQFKYYDRLQHLAIPKDYTIGQYKFERVFNRYINAVEPKEYLFECNGEKMKSKALYQAFRRLGGFMRIHLNPHAFRHYVGTQVAIEKGAVVASQLLGHSNPNTIAKYIHIDKANVSAVLPSMVV